MDGKGKRPDCPFGFTQGKKSWPYTDKTEEGMTG